ncbi:protein C8orf37 homolog isoform X1 [Seriola lalandi dorsalis]|uniref:Cilia- and flagella-associated protein 418 n=1 Tax=Seriola lalandi dorsalis TaxID=1841481 RepID=A0A3B4WKJ0_SERLL|nr:protein C8orf37 homolog isoform X1 [Seriola lalandi dorsalis]
MHDDDDLDELLDEVEKKFCRNVSVASTARGEPREAGKCGKETDGQKKHNATKPREPISSITEDIDALLEELLEEDNIDSPQSKSDQFPKGPQVEKKPSSQFGGRKCCPVFVGGSSVANGVGTATSKRSCDQLRCISCDFRVLMFDDCEWDPSCDYLFLSGNNSASADQLDSNTNKQRHCVNPAKTHKQREQEQHAGPSEAQSQAEEEERFPGVRLPVQLVLLLGADGPQGPGSAQMGLWEAPGLTSTPRCCRTLVKNLQSFRITGQNRDVTDRKNLLCFIFSLCLFSWFLS